MERRAKRSRTRSTARDPAAKAMRPTPRWRRGAAGRGPRAARMSWSSAAVSLAWRALTSWRPPASGSCCSTGRAREWRLRRLPEPGRRRSRDERRHRLLEGRAPRPTPCSVSTGSMRVPGHRRAGRGVDRLGGRGARPRRSSPCNAPAFAASWWARPICAAWSPSSRMRSRWPLSSPTVLRLIRGGPSVPWPPTRAGWGRVSRLRGG